VDGNYQPVGGSAPKFGTLPIIAEILTARRSATVTVNLSTRLSVCYTRGLCPHGSTYTISYLVCRLILEILGIINNGVTRMLCRLLGLGLWLGLGSDESVAIFCRTHDWRRKLPRHHCLISSCASLQQRLVEGHWASDQKVTQDERVLLASVAFSVWNSPDR